MAKRRKALRPQHKVFALTYLANGRNASAAYREAYPGKKTDRVCESAGHRLLRNVEVARFIEERTGAVLEQLEYDGDQAIRDIGKHATYDIRQLFDKDGRLLPVHQWPDEVADAVKTIQPTPFGIKVGLVDKLSARITIAKAAGRFAPKQAKGRRFTYGQLLGDGPLPDEGK